MSLFVKVFRYKESVVNKIFILQNIYCNCSIYQFISNLTILTFSNVMDLHLLEGLMDLATVCVREGEGGWSVQLEDKAQRWGREFKGMRTPWVTRPSLQILCKTQTRVFPFPDFWSIPYKIKLS